MQTLRNGTAFIFWLLIISFGLLWVLSDVNFFDAVVQGPTSLGSVNGEPISFEEYNSRITSYSNNYTQQTGESPSPELRAVYENQAWEDLITARLLNQKMDELGITVTDQELLDMVTGENPDPFIQQQFGMPDGSIDRGALNQALNAPENSEVWVLIENQLRQQRRQQKLNNFIRAGIQVTDAEIEELFKANNTFLDIRYIRFPYSEVPESEITITDSDLRTYYRNNPKEFERKETYRFEYVTFSILPTADDTARTTQDVAALREGFASTENDSLFLIQNASTTPYRDSFVAKDEVREEFQVVNSMKKGDVSDLISFAGRVHILKKVDENRTEVKFRIFSRDVEADPFSTINATASTAEDFRYFANEANDFSGEAAQRNLETNQGFATKGNSFIAGIGSSQQVLNFLETAEKGEISNVFELPTQLLVLRVTEIEKAGTRPFEEVKAQIENTVRLQKRKDKVSEQASAFLSENSSLNDIASASGKEIFEAGSQLQSATVLTGAGREPEVIGAAFAMLPGKVSKPLQGNTGVFIMEVKNRREPDIAGLTPENRQQLRQQIELQKNAAYLNVWLDELKSEASIKDNRSRLIRPN